VAIFPWISIGFL